MTDRLKAEIAGQARNDEGGMMEDERRDAEDGVPYGRDVNL